MPRGSGHLLRLGALAVAAALVAAAAWTYTGQSDSSGGNFAEANESLGKFSVPGLLGKSDRAHGDKHGGATQAPRTRRADRAGSATPALSPAISGPAPAPRP